jgi:hypothetical protein
MNFSLLLTRLFEPMHKSPQVDVRVPIQEPEGAVESLGEPFRGVPLVFFL